MKSSIGFVFAFLFIAFIPAVALAHCDTMNGPVVTAARKALDAGDVNLVLIWVQPKDETEIKAAFVKTMAVRKFNSAAKELADMYFFETLVRIHRAGEGVPYTGLKPAETEIEPGIAEADKAIEANSVDHLVEFLSGAVQERIRHLFAELTAHRTFSANDVAAGREYVRTYVEFIHFVERLHQTVSSATNGHSPQPVEVHHH